MIDRSVSSPVPADFWRSWLIEKALPLWAGIGISSESRLPYEALDMAGKPCADLALRIRVPARQVYSFATAARLFPELAFNLSLRSDEIFEFFSSDAVLSPDGHLASQLSPSSDILDAPHELYDIAFFMLAASAMAALGRDVKKILGRIDNWLEMLACSEGWAENAMRRLPRRQNPHMHLFEASLALWEVLGREQDLKRAKVCFDLFRNHFLQKDGVVLEYFEANWEPVPEGQAVEPGHMAEWLWLIDRYEQATGIESGIDLDLLWQAILSRQAAPALLPDQSLPQSPTCRLWPQTEFLKAALVMERRGTSEAAALADAIMQRLHEDYFEPVPSGGWIDQRDLEGRIMSKTMPASSFYHIVEAAKLWMTIRSEGH